MKQQTPDLNRCSIVIRQYHNFEDIPIDEFRKIWELAYSEQKELYDVGGSQIQQDLEFGPEDPFLQQLEQWKKSLANWRIIVALKDEKIIGFLCGTVVDTDYNVFKYTDNCSFLPVTCIRSFYVINKFRGLRAGVSMLVHFVDSVVLPFCKRNITIPLEQNQFIVNVPYRNKAGESFFKKFGGKRLQNSNFCKCRLTDIVIS